ncbi:putative Inner membrane protein YhaI [Vibrio chagasii]|nr:putative Inner membrane protein YhaI [Vibrio chagasii]
MKYYFLAWKRSLDFSGCSSRKECWMFLLVHTLVAIGCIGADIVMNMTTWFDTIYSAVSFIPMLSVIVRRLHDINKSGFWGLVFFIPIVGPFWLIYLLAQSTNTHLDGEVLV